MREYGGLKCAYETSQATDFPKTVAEKLRVFIVHLASALCARSTASPFLRALSHARSHGSLRRRLSVGCATR